MASKYVSIWISEFNKTAFLTEHSEYDDNAEEKYDKDDDGRVNWVYIACLNKSCFDVEPENVDGVPIFLLLSVINCNYIHNKYMEK